METRITIVIFTFLMTFFSFQAEAQSEWELKKEEEGIVAYTRSRPGIKFKEYKVEMEIDATLSQALAIFKDFPVHTQLFPGTENIKAMLDEEDHYVTYVKFNIPFPARDRDALFDNRLSFDPDSKTLSIYISCLEDETDEGLIQIKYCEGSWTFTDIGNGRLKVVNQLIVDPGGFAPAFIVNSKTVDDPIKTFKSLKVMIDDDKYRGHSFSLLGN